MLLLLLFSPLVVSYSLQLHGVQRARLPCPSPSPRVCSNSCPLCQWCHPTISSSVSPFFSCLQSFKKSGSFSMSWFFASGGQSIGSSASALVLSMNIQGWFPLWLTGLISLQSKGLWLSRVFFSTNSSETSILWHSPSSPALTSIHDYGRNHSFDYMNLCRQSDASAF